MLKARKKIGGSPNLAVFGDMTRAVGLEDIRDMDECCFPEFWNTADGTPELLWVGGLRLSPSNAQVRDRRARRSGRRFHQGAKCAVACAFLGGHHGAEQKVPGERPRIHA